MSVIEVRMLDGIHVIRDGETISLQPKRLALLVYLLLESRGATVRRDQLLALFWPESDTEHARNALRQALFALRSALGSGLIVARGSTELVVDVSDVRSDALATLDAVERSDHATVNELYRSDFLAGLHVDDNAELERWIDETRLRFRRFATTAVRMLAAQHDAPPERRLRYLERLLMLAPYDESIAMQLVSLHATRGDRATAIETFRRFAARLKEDLEIEPSDAFVSLVGDAKAMEGVSSQSSPRLAPSTHRPSVGSPAVTPSLLPRSLRRRRAGLILLALIACAGVLLSWRTTADFRLVQVEPFRASAQNVTHSASVVPVAALATERLRGVIATVPGFSVLGERVSGFRRRRAGTVVQGTVEMLSPQRWRASASVVATESAMLLQRIEVEGSAPDSVVAALIDRVSAVVATRLNMELGWGQTLHRPSSLQALTLFQSAFDAVERGDAEAGITRFEQAWALDSTFLFAGILAAGNALTIDAYATGDRLLASLAPFESQMLPLERRQYLRARALAQADTRGILVESRAIVSLEPRVPFLLAQLAQDAWLANRPREAIATLDALRRVTGQNEDDAISAGIRAAALHTLGRFREELVTIDGALASTTAQPHTSTLRIAPLAARGEIDSLRVMIAAIASRDPARDLARVYRLAALELHAHGFTQPAGELFAEGAQWLITHRATGERTLARVMSAAELLLDASQVAQADSLLTRRSALLDSSRSVAARSAILSMRGVLAARQGRREAAIAIADSLASFVARGRNGTDTYRRARISAALGDTARTLTLIAQAFAEGFVTTRDLHVDPVFTSLRRDARFKQWVTPTE